MSPDSSLTFRTGVEEGSLDKDMGLLVARSSESLTVLVLLRIVILLKLVEELPVLIARREREEISCSGLD